MLTGELEDCLKNFAEAGGWGFLSNDAKENELLKLALDAVFQQTEIVKEVYPEFYQKALAR